MGEMTEIEKQFIINFSNLELTDIQLPEKREVEFFSKFLTNEIAIKYLGNMLKDIDIRLYLEFLKMLLNSIDFNDKYNVEQSVCVSNIFGGVTRDVEIKVPNINNGLDLMATAHELGHGLKSFTKVNNERHLHSNTIYNETISILFGRLCLERYINDFGYDIYAEQFELLNISNAIKCLGRIKGFMPDYIKQKTALDNTSAKIIKNPKYDDYKYRAFVKDVENLKNEIFKLISYPIGIALANVYDNFDKKKKEKYLQLITKYLLNIKHIEFEMILDYFDIPLDATFYIENFEEYINKFKKQNAKKLVLGG